MAFNSKVYLFLVADKCPFRSLLANSSQAVNRVRNFKIGEIGSADGSRKIRETNTMGHFHYCDVRSYRFNVRLALYLSHTS